jgi:hypothetical protein
MSSGDQPGFEVKTADMYMIDCLARWDLRGEYRRSLDFWRRFGPSQNSDSKNRRDKQKDQIWVHDNFTFCLGLQPIPKSMSHSLILEPMTSGWSSCR